MADYKTQEISGSSWQRCYKVTVLNNRNSTPTITFEEQKVYLMPDREVVLNVDSCSATFDPAGVIDLRNPETGDKVGHTITQAELYAIIYSLYMQTAEARDNRITSPAPFIQPNIPG